MGFWSGVKDWGKKAIKKVKETAVNVWNGAKEVGREVVDTVKEYGGKALNKTKEVVSSVIERVEEVTHKIGEGASKIWASFTGEKYLQEAKAIYNAAKARYDEALKKFGKDTGRLVGEIGNCLSDINRMKMVIYETLFPQFVELAARLHKYSIESRAILENGFYFQVNMSKIKTRDQVLLLDFDKHRVSNTLKAIFTLGMYTRAKAKDSLEFAKEEAKAVDYEIARMDQEVARLRTVKAAIENVQKYFTDLIGYLKVGFERLEYALFTLKNQLLVQAQTSGQGNYRKLPDAHLRTFEFLNDVVAILAKMAQSRYLQDSDEVKLTQEEISMISQDLESGKILKRAQAVA